MLDGRQRHDWSIAAAVMSVVANTARDPKRSRLLKPADFDPFHKPQRPVKVDVWGVGPQRRVHRPPHAGGRQGDSCMKSLTTRHYVYLGALILLALVLASCAGL
ncbi:MAG: hypothetical protein ACK462_13580, partial [Planctomyces sp.]